MNLPLTFMRMVKLELIRLHMCITDLLLFLLIGKVEMEAFYPKGIRCRSCHIVTALLVSGAPKLSQLGAGSGLRIANKMHDDTIM
jgi:hypothetical protein